MKDKDDLAQGWLAKAASDLAAANLLLEGEAPMTQFVFTFNKP
jgi:hypothetical protein